jgi:predicted AAA+ superfamily ATPase
MLERLAYSDLKGWKSQANRKPLIIRGARQVGKTTLVRQFSREYDTFLELNLERAHHAAYFDRPTAKEVLNLACLDSGVVMGEGATLLFIDEIQAVPMAVQMLRYFYEDLPDLHVIAAGSLLEFALQDVASFPVGRVQNLYLSPINFAEYLMAKGNPAMCQAYDMVPLPEHLTEPMLVEFKKFAIVGGMPEILSNFLASGNVSQLGPAYREIWEAYKDDATKYGRTELIRKVILHVMEAAPFEKDRIKLAKLGGSDYRAREVGEALRALSLAGVILTVYPTTEVNLPGMRNLGLRPRLQFLDTGLLNHLLQNQGDLIQLDDLNDAHRGRVVPHLVIQELRALHRRERYTPMFWVRQKAGSDAEVDLVCPFGGHLIPIEVKSGKAGKLRSLHQFVDRSNHPYAVRLFAGPFSIEEHTTPAGTPYLLMNVPYVAAAKIFEYLAHFMAAHPL